MSKNVFETQKPREIVVDLGIANIGAGNGVTAKLPTGALLTRVLLLTTTAFNGTTNTATIGDGTTTFANAVDLTSAGSETVAGAPKFYPAGGTLTFSLAQTGTATAGRALALAEYVIVGAGDDIYG